MATLPSIAGALTLSDLAKAMNPDGTIGTVVEALNQSNEILKDMKWIEGNLVTGNQTIIRTGLPSGTWRQLYQGVQPSKSDRAQIQDLCGMLEARTEVDVDAARMGGNENAVRASELRALIEGVGQQMATTLFYGNASLNPEQFNGFTPRFNALTGAPSTANVLSAGGTGSTNTSIWLVVWGEETCMGIVPKGSQAGLQHQDLGEMDAFDGSTPGRRYRAFSDLIKWKAGLCVKDWRYVVRICNINVADLRAGTGTQATTAATNILRLMSRAQDLIPMTGRGQAVFYCNRTVKSSLKLMGLDRSTNAVTVQPALSQFGGTGAGEIAEGGVSFLGTPLRTVDALLNTEAQVS
jgi:hypothetical protein